MDLGNLSKQVLRVTLAVALASFSVYAADEARPNCDRSHAGKFWPSAANTDQKVALAFFRCGELEICTRKYLGGFAWERTSISIDQLKAQHKHESAPVSKTCPSAASPAPGV